MTIIRENRATFTPDTVASLSTLLDHATVVDQPALGRNSVLGVFQSWNCLGTTIPAELCVTPHPEKPFEESVRPDGLHFGVHGGTVCRTVGYDADEEADGLAAAFELNETKGVEQALINSYFTGNVPNSDTAAAVDLTPIAGPVSPRVGMAILEGFAGNNYAGAPTIHAPRTVASYLAAAHDVVEDDDLLWTRIGSKFVNGAGYEPSVGPAGATPEAGEFWMYASGEVYVERGQLKTIPTTNWTANEQLILAERDFLVAVDCFAAAIRVEVY